MTDVLMSLIVGTQLTQSHAHCAGFIAPLFSMTSLNCMAFGPEPSSSLRRGEIVLSLVCVSSSFQKVCEHHVGKTWPACFGVQYPAQRRHWARAFAGMCGVSFMVLREVR